MPGHVTPRPAARPAGARGSRSPRTALMTSSVVCARSGNLSTIGRGPHGMHTAPPQAICYYGRPQDIEWHAGLLHSPMPGIDAAAADGGMCPQSSQPPRPCSLWRAGKGSLVKLRECPLCLLRGCLPVAVPITMSGQSLGAATAACAAARRHPIRAR